MGQVLACDRCERTMPFKEAVKIIVRGPQTERTSGVQRDWDLCKACQIAMGITFDIEHDEIGARLYVPALLVMNETGDDTAIEATEESEQDNG